MTPEQEWLVALAGGLLFGLGIVFGLLLGAYLRRHSHVRHKKTTPAMAPPHQRAVPSARASNRKPK